jgi:hypothetical protein
VILHCLLHGFVVFSFRSTQTAVTFKSLVRFGVISEIFDSLLFCSQDLQLEDISVVLHIEIKYSYEQD